MGYKVELSESRANKMVTVRLNGTSIVITGMGATWPDAGVDFNRNIDSMAGNAVLGEIGVSVIILDVTERILNKINLD
jgi:hypothetical protein